MEKRRLESIERYILALFRDRGKAKLLAREIFESADEFANADLVRAFEDLEKKWRLLVRHTSEGNDWVSLTREGAAHAKVNQSEVDLEPEALPHPPKSAP
jgi:Ribonuclease G/E